VRIQERGGFLGPVGLSLLQERSQDGLLDAHARLRAQDHDLAIRVPEGQHASRAPDHPAVEPDLPTGRPALLPLA